MLGPFGVDKGVPPVSTVQVITGRPSAQMYGTVSSGKEARSTPVLTTSKAQLLVGDIFSGYGLLFYHAEKHVQKTSRRVVDRQFIQGSSPRATYLQRLCKA